jgi:radical SAM superfamily enzyme YgiQ (UPF0313 family)
MAEWTVALGTTPRTRALLISTYELGRQPFGLASPAAWLRRANVTVDCVDASRDSVSDELLAAVDLTGFYLPMHTATRLASPLIRRARAVNPRGRICAYGLYAPLNAEWLRSLGVDDVLDGEFEHDLARIAGDLEPRVAPVEAPRVVPKLQFVVPDRTGLPALQRYAALELGDGRRKVMGFTEASRGCRHLCRHCPVVPVYDGAFRVVQADVVLADIAAQVAAGAEHISFGDPDFLNGPTHAVRLVRALHDTHPAVTYDVTVKVEHLLRHRDLLAVLRDTGCLFVTSAVESIDDEVLARLAKGHTRRDFLEVAVLCRAAGLTLVPTFVAFHPWTTLEGYCELLDTIADLDLVGHVAPVQLAIRLLIPRGSRMLELPDVAAMVGPYDAATLTYPWRHPDPRVDALQDDIMRTVARSSHADRARLFEDIRRMACARAGRPAPAPPARAPGAPVPYVTEPWYCCAEPTADQLRMV